MKNATLSFLLLGVLGAGFFAGTWYSQRERVSASGLHARRILMKAALHCGVDE